MTKDEIEDLGIRYNTIIVFKRIMEFFCRICSRECNQKEKLSCIDIALKIARNNSDLKGVFDDET